MPALRLADLSSQQNGFSLLNHCNYGYDGKANVLRLSLLRFIHVAGPDADEACHEFTEFSLSARDWKQAQTVRRGTN